ncbi:hypothetical protein BLNAU_12716 [Blattamonas nauphoetae]|uniref:Uncharacterized protein n=1 Tax=Blattamonas nauphoetae TaxID=2049346 RepID=A0ABQ9XLQ0_9EUKA|nr:hypothetical protein BLNAU_12716 [Blattamonas nauphoetae]
MNKNSSRTHPKSRPKPKGKPKSQQFAYHPLLNDPVDTLKRYEDRKSKKNEKLQSIKNRLQDALKEYDQVSYEAETGKPLEDGISDDVRARVHKVSEYNYDNAHNFLKTSFAQHNKTEKEKNAILADLQDWITRHVNDDEVVDMTETKLPSNIVPLTSDSDPIFITNPVLERTYSPTLSGTDNEPDETTNPVVPKLNMDALITSTQSARKSLERLHNGQLSTIRQKYFKEMEDLAWKYENTDDWVEEKIESLRREVEALTNQVCLLIFV